MNKLFLNRWFWLGAVFLVVLTGLYLRPVPKATAVSQLPVMPLAKTVSLPWPAGGQAALGAEDYGLLASHGIVSPVPIGSTAKVITALAVLKQKPLAAGSQGPIITLASSDIGLFNSYYSRGGSVTQVSAGEQISEYQALQSMLIPSSNNMADTLAAWAFGSVDAYIKYANQMVGSLGLPHTKVGDTNGFSDATTSTAEDLVKLGLAAMKNPVIADIVGQSTAQIPVEGVIKNVNFLLGQDGVVGIKTGNTDKAGGCYLFASGQLIQGHKITLVGAVLDQPQLVNAIQAAPPLIRAAVNGFVLVIAVHKYQVLGYYTAPWKAEAGFEASSDLTFVAWQGASAKVSIQTDDIEPSSSGTAVGKVTVSELGLSSSADLVLSKSLQPPSPLWRLTR